MLLIYFLFVTQSNVKEHWVRTKGIEEDVDLKDMIHYSLHPRTSKKFRHIHFLRKHVLFYFPILLTLHPPDSPGTQIKLCNQ